MIINQILLVTVILFITPLMGLLFFFVLKRRMKNERIINPPIKALFVIFITYGGLILLVLTAFFLRWSGAASLGTFYLILGAPIVMSLIAYRNYNYRQISKYHQLIYKLAILYFPLTILTFLILYWSKAYLRC